MNDFYQAFIEVLNSLFNMPSYIVRNVLLGPPSSSPGRSLTYEVEYCADTGTGNFTIPPQKDIADTIKIAAQTGTLSLGMKDKGYNNLTFLEPTVTLSTQSSGNSLSTNSNTKTEMNIPAVAGGVVGGVAFIIIVGLLIYFCCAAGYFQKKETPTKDVTASDIIPLEEQQSSPFKPAFMLDASHISNKSRMTTPSRPASSAPSVHSAQI